MLSNNIWIIHLSFNCFQFSTENSSLFPANDLFLIEPLQTYHIGLFWLYHNFIIFWLLRYVKDQCNESSKKFNDHSKMYDKNNILVMIETFVTNKLFINFLHQQVHFPHCLLDLHITSQPCHKNPTENW